MDELLVVWTRCCKVGEKLQTPEVQEGQIEFQAPSTGFPILPNISNLKATHVVYPFSLC